MKPAIISGHCSDISRAARLSTTKMSRFYISLNNIMLLCSIGALQICIGGEMVSVVVFAQPIPSVSDELWTGVESIGKASGRKSAVGVADRPCLG